MEAAVNSHLSPDDKLLLAVQSGNFQAQSELVEHFGGYIAKITYQRCLFVGVPKQEAEDIVQDVYQTILDPRTARFSPGRGTAKRYFVGIVWNAVKRARTFLRPAPPMVWRTNKAMDTENLSTQIASRDLEDDHMHHESEDPRGAFSFSALELEDILEVFFRAEAPRTIRGIKGVLLDGRKIQEAALEAGVSRFCLSRQIRQLRLAIEVGLVEVIAA